MAIRNSLSPAQPPVEARTSLVNLNRFDLASLRLFVAVIDSGSLTGGAERFGISLAAASKRIAELEAHVGTPLFERGTRGISATAAGATLQQHAVELVARLEQLATAMDDFHRGTRGHVRLWANSSACNGFLPEVLATYCARYPNVRVDLEELLSEDIVRAVASGAAELGVIGENTACDGLESVVCNHDELVLLTPADHTLAGAATVNFADALQHDFVGLSRATSLMRNIRTAAERTGMPLRIRIQVRSFDAMCRMVAMGLGVGILPRASAEPHVASMKLHLARLDGVRDVWQLLLVMRSRATLSIAAGALADLIVRSGTR